MASIAVDKGYGTAMPLPAVPDFLHGDDQERLAQGVEQGNRHSVMTVARHCGVVMRPRRSQIPSRSECLTYKHIAIRGARSAPDESDHFKLPA